MKKCVAFILLLSLMLTACVLHAFADDGVRVGDYVTFGAYYQTAWNYNKTPIEWLVLDRVGDKALLISRYALDCKPYQLTRKGCSWGSSYMRSWLNNSFLNDAFNDWEQAIISSAKVTADPNPQYSTWQGFDQYDKVFLLSVAEAERYFAGDLARGCIPTEYAVKQGAYVPASLKYVAPGNDDPTDVNCCWWLRTGGFSDEEAAYVYPEGRISNSGITVSHITYAVRPAIWVNVNGLLVPTPVPTATPTPAPTVTPSPTPVALPTAANARTIQSGDYTYVELTDGTVRITDYTGTILYLEIPQTLDGKRVTSIGDNAFASAFGQTVVVPEGVTDLGWRAFSAMTGLKEIQLPASLRAIDGLAFAKCEELFNLTIPEGVTTLGSSLFEKSGVQAVWLPSTLNNVDESALSEAEYLRAVHLPEGMTRTPQYLCRNMDTIKCVVIPETVTELGEYFCYDCPDLVCVYVPSSVTSIVPGALDSWKQLTVYVHENSAAHRYCEQEGINYQLVHPTTDADFEYQLLEDGTACITRYLGNNPEVTIPAMLDGHPVTAIGERAFIACYTLQRLTISEGVTTIGNSAFGSCESLVEVKLPESLTTIDVSAFSTCTALTHIDLPSGLRKIGKSAFGFCVSLQDVTIPGSVEDVGEGAFSSCYALTSITVEDGAKSIGINAFYNAPWKTLSIGEGTTRVGTKAFYARYARTKVRCNLPASLQSIQSEIFGGTFKRDADTLCTVVKGSFAEWYCQSKGIDYTCVPEQDLTGRAARSLLPAALHEVDSHLTLGSLQVDIPAGFTLAETTGQTFAYKANPVSRSSEARLTMSCVNAQNAWLVSTELPLFGEEADVLAGLTWFDYQLDNGMRLARAVAAQHEIQGKRRSVAAAMISDGETTVLVVCTYLGGNEHIALDYVDTVLSGAIRVSDVPPPTPTPAPTPSPVEAFFSDTRTIRVGELELTIPAGSYEFSEESESDFYRYFYYALPTGGRLLFTITTIPIDQRIDQPPISMPWEAREVLSDLVFDRFVEPGVHTFKPADYDLLQLDDAIFCARKAHDDKRLSGSHVETMIVVDLTNYYTIEVSSALGTDEICEDFLLRIRAGIREAAAPVPTPTPPPAGTDSASASAEDFEYDVLEDGTICITKYLGSAEIVAVPQKIDGRQVTVMGAEVFSDWKRNLAVREVILPDGLLKLDEFAFSGCEQLERVHIPQSVMEIGCDAFSMCENLVEVELPQGLTTIESLLFDGCTRLTRIRIPDGVTTIGNDAFFRCESLVEVNIPHSVKTIGINPFTRCDKLRGLDIPADHPVFSFEDGVLFERETGRLISFLSDAASYTIPARTTEIAIGAFCGRHTLKHVMLNDRLSEIPGSAFEYTGLTEVVIPDSVTEIDYFAFAGCHDLVSAELGRHVTRIGESAFARCEKLEWINLPTGLEMIGDYTFEDCVKLRTLDIPDSVTFIGMDAFSGCDALTLTVGASSYAEAYCRENGVRYVLRGRSDVVVTAAPTAAPTTAPTAMPTSAPTAVPTTAPTAAPTLSPAPAAAEKIPIDGVPDAYQQPVWQASVNSYVVASSGTYSAENAVDGLEHTCWQFSTKNCPLGTAALEVILAPGSTVDELWIKNGFWYINQGLDQYTRNGRPKQIGVSFLYDGEKDYRDEIQLTLQDDKARKDWQKVTLGRHENVCAVRIRIISIYKGTKFKTDVAISEVMLVEREGGSAPIVYETLKRGSKGDAVLAMKVRLQELGYFKKGADLSVSYNDTCVERVKQFQKVNGLPQTGVADHQTLSLLYSDAALPKN